MSCKRDKKSSRRLVFKLRKTLYHHLSARQLGLVTCSRNVARILVEEKATLPAQNEPCEISGESRSTFLMAFSSDKTRVASAHGDHMVRVTEISSGKCTHVLKGHPRTPWCLEFHPSYKDILASGCLDGHVRIWDLHGGGSELWCSFRDSRIASLTFHPLDRVLVIATANTLHFWDWRKSKPFAATKTSSEEELVKWVKFDPLGQMLYTAIQNPNMGEGRGRAGLRNPSRLSDLSSEHTPRWYDPAHSVAARAVQLDSNLERALSPQDNDALENARSYAYLSGSHDSESRYAAEMTRAGVLQGEERTVERIRNEHAQDQMWPGESSLSDGLLVVSAPVQLGSSGAGPVSAASLSDSDDESDPVLSSVVITPRQVTRGSGPSHLLPSTSRRSRRRSPLRLSSWMSMAQQDHLPRTQPPVDQADRDASTPSVPLPSRLSSLYPSKTSSHQPFNVSAMAARFNASVIDSVPSTSLAAARDSSSSIGSFTRSGDTSSHINQSAFTAQQGSVLASSSDPLSSVSRTSLLTPLSVLNRSSSLATEQTSPSVIRFPSNRFLLDPPEMEPEPVPEPTPVAATSSIGADALHAVEPTVSNSSREGNCSAVTRDCIRLHTRSHVELMRAHRQMRMGYTQNFHTQLEMRRLRRFQNELQGSQAVGTSESDQPQHIASMIESEVRQALENMQNQQSVIRDTLNALDRIESRHNLDADQNRHNLENLSYELDSRIERLDNLFHQVQQIVVQLNDRIRAVDEVRQRELDMIRYQLTTSQMLAVEIRQARFRCLQARLDELRRRLRSNSQVPQHSAGIWMVSESAPHPLDTGAPTTAAAAVPVRRESLTEGAESLPMREPPTESGATVYQASESLEDQAEIRRQQIRRRQSTARVVIERLPLQNFAGVFVESTITSNLIQFTHRIQQWDFSKCQIPVVSDAESNVIVRRCNVHNDASCCLSQDGNLLVCFIYPRLDQGHVEDMVLGVYSLLPHSLGQCLHTRTFGSSPVSVSVSPLNNFILVGLATKRLNWFFNTKQMVAQVFRLKESDQEEDSMEHVCDLMHSCESDFHHRISVNSALWLPGVGEGLIYGTNRGDLYISRPGEQSQNKEGALGDTLRMSTRRSLQFYSPVNARLQGNSSTVNVHRSASTQTEGSQHSRW